MELEDTGIVVNVRYLPGTIMSNAEYKAKRDAAVESMLRDRLATKGILVMQMAVREHEFVGVPTHQKHSVMMQQFERQAEREFHRQVDNNCMECPHKKIEVSLDSNMMDMTQTVRAKCFCGAKRQGGATCFDGYMPGSNSWLWPRDRVVRASFIMDKPNPQGLVFAKLEFAIGEEPEIFDPSRRAHLDMYGDVHDDPPGPMTRINADGAYMTKEEIEMADAALAKLAKAVRATLPSPQPQTPCEDAW